LNMDRAKTKSSYVYCMEIKLFPKRESKNMN